MKSPDVVEAEGYELISRGNALLAEARRLRAGAKPENDNGAPEWIDASASPLGKRKTHALCRTGALESSKVGRRVLVKAASLAAFLARHKRSNEASDDEALFGVGS